MLSDVLKNKYTVAVAVGATLFVNYLANALPINGMNTGELSDALKIYFVPAGYVFSIWGLIYLSLIGFVYYQFKASKENQKLLSKMNPWFILSCLANIIWIFVWHYEMVVLSVLFMLIILYSVKRIYGLLDVGKIKRNNMDKILLETPFSLYLGWISVATIANISGALYVIGWDGLGLPGQSWSAIMITVATLLGLLRFKINKDYTFVLVLIWAFIGIWNKFPGEGVIVGSALTSIVILIATMLNNSFKNIKFKLK